MDEKLQLLRDRYWLLAGPLALMMAIGIGSAPVLAWIAGAVLLGVTGVRASASMRG